MSVPDNRAAAIITKDDSSCTVKARRMRIIMYNVGAHSVSESLHKFAESCKHIEPKIAEAASDERRVVY